MCLVFTSNVGRHPMGLIKADMNRREIQANVARKKFEIRTAIFFG
jgi:hypothetical protein